MRHEGVPTGLEQRLQRAFGAPRNGVLRSASELAEGSDPSTSFSMTRPETRAVRSAHLSSHDVHIEVSAYVVRSVADCRSPRNTSSTPSYPPLSASEERVRLVAIKPLYV
jgi:hypothetical protein